MTFFSNEGIFLSRCSFCEDRHRLFCWMMDRVNQDLRFNRTSQVIFFPNFYALVMSFRELFSKVFSRLVEFRSIQR